MTKREAREWVWAHDDQDDDTVDDMPVVFAALVGRKPDEEEQADLCTMWSICVDFAGDPMISAAT